MRVAVIGGGLAGSSAAWSLAQSGKALVTVFDQGRRPGGRASSREYEQAHFDHGLQFIRQLEGDEPCAVMNELKRANVLKEWRPNLVKLGGGSAGGFFDILKTGTGSLLVGCPSSSSICDHLLANERISVKSSTQVKNVALSDDGKVWSVGEGEFDALIITDILAASPRSPSHIRAEGERTKEVMSGFYEAGSHFEGASIFTIMMLMESLPFDVAAIDSKHVSLIVDETSKPGRSRVPGGQRAISVITNETFGAELSGRDANGKLPPQSPAYLEERSQKILAGMRSDLEGFGVEMKKEPHFIKCHRWGSAYPRSSLTLDPFVASGRFALAGDFLGNEGSNTAIKSGQRAAKLLCGEV